MGFKLNFKCSIADYCFQEGNKLFILQQVFHHLAGHAAVCLVVGVVSFGIVVGNDKNLTIVMNRSAVVNS